MPNITRERSDFKFELSQNQVDALVGLVLAKDRPLEDLIMEALDQYIEREENSCPKKA